MNRFISFCAFALLTVPVFSQRVSYIYLQTENSQPFFLRMGEKVESSSASGYLILSQLADSTYHFVIGFPEKKWPEQSFAVEVKGKDKGYLIKNFGDKGWGLFDLQALSVIMSRTSGTIQQVAAEPVSDFTHLLSKAANDPSLREAKPAAQKEEVVKPPEAKQPVVTEAEVIKPVDAVKKEEAAADVKKPEVAQAPVYTPSRVIRGTESSTTEGVGILFIDEYADGSADSISILIPPPPYRPPVAAPAEENREKKFLDIQAGPGKNEVAAEDKKETAPGNECKVTATQNDFLKLRKKMAAQKTDDAMLDEARKAFKQKCYTTAQLKNLHTLFLNDAARYQFFDAAYPYVSDPAAFPSLESEFRNDYYLKRFKAIIRP